MRLHAERFFLWLSGFLKEKVKTYQMTLMSPPNSPTFFTPTVFAYYRFLFSTKKLGSSRVPVVPLTPSGSAAFRKSKVPIRCQFPENPLALIPFSNVYKASFLAHKCLFVQERFFLWRVTRRESVHELLEVERACVEPLGAGQVLRFRVVQVVPSCRKNIKKMYSACL